MDEPDRNELVRQMFALVTAGLEDCATLAVEAQARDAPHQDRLMRRLQVQIEHAAVLLNALRIISKPSTGAMRAEGSV
jgi:hypothetical protein